MFTVTCENGTFSVYVRATWPFSHAVISVDTDCYVTGKRVQSSVTTYGECKQCQAAACNLCDWINQDLHTDAGNTELGPSMQNEEGLIVTLWWQWRKENTVVASVLSLNIVIEGSSSFSHACPALTTTCKHTHRNSSTECRQIPTWGDWSTLAYKLSL